MPKISLPLLVLMRHGECKWRQYEDLMFGQLDIPLNESGYFQMELSGNSLSVLLQKIWGRKGNIKSFVSSDLKRCRSSAQIICNILKNELKKKVHYELDSNLREYHLGAWEAVPFKKLKRDVLNFVDAYEKNPFYIRPPSGESHLCVAKRIAPLVYAINNDISTIEILEFLNNKHFITHNFDELLKLVEHYKITLNFHIWVLHEGAARMALRLLNVNTSFREQNVRAEFLEDQHQTFFERGDFLILRPDNHFFPQAIEGVKEHHLVDLNNNDCITPDSFNLNFGCHTGWKIIYHHKSNIKMAA